jgi:hypothetical protein
LSSRDTGPTNSRNAGSNSAHFSHNSAAECPQTSDEPRPRPQRLEFGRRINQQVEGHPGRERQQEIVEAVNEFDGRILNHDQIYIARAPHVAPREGTDEVYALDVVMGQQLQRPRQLRLQLGLALLVYAENRRHLPPPPTGRSSATSFHRFFLLPISL